MNIKRRPVLHGSGTPTIFLNSKGHLIYEDPSKNNYYVINKKGKRRLGKPKAAFMYNAGQKRLVTSNNFNRVPFALRKKMTVKEMAKALNNARSTISSLSSQHSINQTIINECRRNKSKNVSPNLKPNVIQAAKNASKNNTTIALAAAQEAAVNVTNKNLPKPVQTEVIQSVTNAVVNNTTQENTPEQIQNVITETVNNTVNAAKTNNNIKQVANETARQISALYKFPSGATTENRIKAVSQNVWKEFEASKRGQKMPANAAWMALKSRGQTVGITPYKSGWIMNKYNWKNLYNSTTDPAEKQVMRYILTMLALNPPYVNRKTGNRNKITNNSIGYMNNNAFNTYLKGIKPVANQGQGLRTAFVRTTASGARLLKPYALPIAGSAILAAYSGGAAAVLPTLRASIKDLIKERSKNLLKGVPFSNKVVNKAMNLAESKFTTSKVSAANANARARKIIESSIENAVVESEMKKWANAGMPITNKAAFTASLRNGKQYLTPNQAKAAFKNATVKGFQGMAAGAVLGTGATIGALAAGSGAATTAAQRVRVNLNKAKINFVKKLLNRAAHGETIPTNMINKAIQRSGGNARVAHALTKGGSVARNLLLSM